MSKRVELAYDLDNPPNPPCPFCHKRLDFVYQTWKTTERSHVHWIKEREVWEIEEDGHGENDELLDITCPHCRRSLNEEFSDGVWKKSIWEYRPTKKVTVIQGYECQACKHLSKTALIEDGLVKCEVCKAPVGEVKLKKVKEDG